MISAVVLTKNEENNIIDCLESLSWCGEIIVVDDYSEDRTISLIGRIGQIGKKTKIYQRHLNGDFAGQRNFGLKKAKGEWVLFVDADERVNEGLRREILKQARRFGGQVQDDEKKYDGFYIRRKDFLFGRWLEYGETGNIRLIRLVRKGCGKWERRVHERLGEFTPSPRLRRTRGELGGTLLHYPHQTIDEFLRKINFYTDLNAKELDSRLPADRQGFRGNDKWVGLSVFIYPLAKFMQNYFLKLGFLDGMAGFLQAMLMSFHSFMTRGKLRCRYDSTFKV